MRRLSSLVQKWNLLLWEGRGFRQTYRNKTAGIKIPPAWSWVPETHFAIHGVKIALAAVGLEVAGGLRDNVPGPGRRLMITTGFLKKLQKEFERQDLSSMDSGFW